MSEDYLSRMDKNLRKIKETGKREFGETLPYHDNGEARSREEVLAERRRKAEWLRRVRKQAGW